MISRRVYKMQRRFVNERRRSSTGSTSDTDTLTIDYLPKYGRIHPWSTYCKSNYHKRPPNFAGPWEDALLHAISDRSQIVDDSDSTTVTLIDGYPKARHHYLIVPRRFELNSIDEATLEHLPLLQNMHDRARKLADKITRDEETAKFNIGYHADPNMKLLHLHVISDDFDSQRIKKPHHWNIFNSEYFIESHKALEVIRKNGRILVDKRRCNDVLQLPPKCNICNMEVDFADLLEHRRSHNNRKYLETLGLR